MNVLSMLARLQGTLGTVNAVEQMLLLPAHPSLDTSGAVVNLVVGYSGSPKSQTALDLTLWIAHQTRLATGKSVMVEVAYVVEELDSALTSPIASAGAFRMDAWRTGSTRRERTLEAGKSHLDKKSNSGATILERETKGGTALALSDPQTMGSTKVLDRAMQFEKADRILWQARCLAEEWRGSLKTHLRFGNVARELRSVVEAEEAALLVLGCDSAEHPLIRQLGRQFPCPVLGTPVGCLEG